MTALTAGLMMINDKSASGFRQGSELREADAFTRSGRARFEAHGLQPVVGINKNKVAADQSIFNPLEPRRSGY